MTSINRVNLTNVSYGNIDRGPYKIGDRYWIRVFPDEFEGIELHQYRGRYYVSIPKAKRLGII